MSTPLTPEQQQHVDQLVNAIARDLRARKSREQIASEMAAAGWNVDEARAAVDNVANQYEQAKHNACAAAGKKRIMIGGLFFVGGLVVTIGTYAAAANNTGGGTYFVAWGAILFGAVDIIRGLVLLNK